jgi:hypothetical protein
MHLTTRDIVYSLKTLFLRIRAVIRCRLNIGKMSRENRYDVSKGHTGFGAAGFLRMSMVTSLGAADEMAPPKPESNALVLSFTGAAAAAAAEAGLVLGGAAWRTKEDE